MKGASIILIVLWKVAGALNKLNNKIRNWKNSETNCNNQYLDAQKSTLCWLEEWIRGV